MDMEERRQHPRYATKISVVLYVGDQIITTNARDVSLGGMGLVLPRAIDDGAPVSLSFYLVRSGHVDETTDRLSIDGSVAWSTPKEDEQFDIGVRFGSLNPDQRRQLHAFIKQVSS